MESIESIVSVIYNFSKNLFTCGNSIKTRKHKLKLRSAQNARAFKHAARHMQELSGTSGRQSPGKTWFTNATSHNAFLVEVNFLSQSDGN